MDEQDYFNGSGINFEKIFERKLYLLVICKKLFVFEYLYKKNIQKESRNVKTWA